MKIICIFNGLGNQMSQYAFYLSQVDNQKVLYNNYYTTRSIKDHNGYELQNLFNIPQKKYLLLDLLVRFARKVAIFNEIPKYHSFASFIMKTMRIIGLKIVLESKDYRYNISHLKPNRGIAIHISGWYSSEYFNGKEELIRNAFKFDTTRLNTLSLEYLDKIKNTNSISIHVRRGDFLHAKNINKWGNVCTLDYYQKAIKKMIDELSNPSFFIFSDDIGWSKENLNKISNFTYIEHNTGEDAWQDMYLISQCKHHIMANSSFSWWGVWLGYNKGKTVIAPNKLHSLMGVPDFFPKEWILIDTKDN